MPTIWEDVRQLIRGGELTHAIELIETWLKGKLGESNSAMIRTWLDELLLHYASVKTVQSETRRRVITREQANVEVREISASILSLLDEMEQREPTPASVPIQDLPSRYLRGTFEKIIGDRSHLQSISWLSRGLECSAGVCRLVSNHTIGTGFRIQNDLLVTNNHVIASANAAKLFTAQFFFEETLDRKMANAINVGIDSSRFWTSSFFDITIVGAKFKFATEIAAIKPVLLARPKPASVGDPVAIIQHPLGGPKQIALTSNEVINIYEHRIQYVTDTLPGSSGAPVFNADWELLAVHHAGGQLIKNKFGDYVFANEGIDIASFQNIPEVRSLIAL